MFEKVDRLFFVIWSIPLRLLCKVTGRDNFYFARLTAKAIPIALALWGFIFMQIMPLIFTPLGYMICKTRLSGIDERERTVRTEANVIQMPAMWRWLRIYSTLVQVLWTLDGNYKYNLVFMLLLSMSCYFELCIQPKRKSPLKRAAEWFAKHPIRLPALHPAPQPG